MTGELLMGTSNGAYAYHEKTNDFSPLPGIPEHLFVAAIIEDHEGTVWIGAHGSGVYYYNPLTEKNGHYEGNPSGADSIVLNTLNAITEDHRHNIWFSTEGAGVYCLGPDRETFTHFTTATGLPSNFIFKVVEDNNNDMWVSTSKGLISLYQGKRPGTAYTRANGLLNDQFNYSSGFKDPEGRLYFGSVKGMVTFNPEDFVRSAFTPSVYITGFQVDNKELAIDKDSSFLKRSIIYTDEITLPYNHSSFSIDFAALSYASPEMTKYSYRMEGLDKEWTNLKANRKVYFTNLSPGKYVFQVRAGAGGAWSPSEKQLTITVLPPFWATGWAYLVYATLLILLAYYLISNYHKRIESKKEKEIYEAKFEFFTNIAHEIRTPLTLIKGPLENLLENVAETPGIREDVTMMERNTNRLIALVTQILDLRQTEIKGFSLNFAKLDIKTVLHETYLNFSSLARKNNLSYKIDMPDQEVSALADEEALNKILSNLFNNAVKYADKEVMVTLYPVAKDDTHFTIEISNDGYTIPSDMKERIFEPFYRLKQTSKQKGTGIGLALARSLAELHKGSLYLKDSLENHNTFVLCLPLKPEQEEMPRPKNKNVAEMK
jgi:signal transduction histidine kinase